MKKHTAPKSPIRLAITAVTCAALAGCGRGQISYLSENGNALHPSEGDDVLNPADFPQTFSFVKATSKGRKLTLENAQGSQVVIECNGRATTKISGMRFGNCTTLTAMDFYCFGYGDLAAAVKDTGMQKLVFNFVRNDVVFDTVQDDIGLTYIDQNGAETKIKAGFLCSKS